jgi:hypothetical protein
MGFLLVSATIALPDDPAKGVFREGGQRPGLDEIRE